MPGTEQPIDSIPSDELAALVELARSLRHGAPARTTQRLLSGKTIGVLCATDEADDDDAALLDRAAVELGARVAHVRLQMTELSDPSDLKQTTRLLGRLYDAVVCRDLAPALVQRLRADAGIPVIDRIGPLSQHLASAVPSLIDATATDDHRRFALQALLLRAIK